MSRSTAKDLETWEDDGGTARPSPGVSRAAMTGTASQLEWARRIKRQVNDEFDRVAALLRSVARKQSEALIGILEDKRAEVMSKRQAGYFIHDWQEIGDQVRQMIFRDAATRRSKATGKGDDDEASIRDRV
jgi:DNA-binding transcriptional MocR family regulator